MSTRAKRLLEWVTRVIEEDDDDGDCSHRCRSTSTTRTTILSWLIKNERANELAWLTHIDREWTSAHLVHKRHRRVQLEHEKQTDRHARTRESDVYGIKEK